MTASPNSRQFAATSACGLLDRVDFQIRRVLKKPEDSQVHDLRVAIRRFTQALKIFESGFDAAAVGKMRRRLDTVMKLAGKVRDCDIALQMLGELDPVPVKIMAKVERKHAKAAVELTDSIARWMAGGEPAAWRLKLAATKRATAQAETAIRAGVSGAILRTARRFFDRGVEAWDSKDAGKRLHRLRIAAKELRYSFELAGEPAEDAKDPWGVGRLKELQSLLGDVHDLGTVRDLLWKHHGSKKMLGPIVNQQRKGVREFRELWKSEYRGGAHRSRWIARAAQLGEALSTAQAAETPVEGVERKSAARAGAAAAVQRSRPIRSIGQ